MNPGANRRERCQCSAGTRGQRVMDAHSLCFEETLISPSIPAGGFSTSFLHLASPWGLARTFGASEEPAGGSGGGRGRGPGAALGTGSR